MASNRDAIEALAAWVNDDVTRLFEAEISNERNGGISPSTLSSTIDSVSQMPDDILREFCEGRDCANLLRSLLMIRDLLPGDTQVGELLDEVEVALTGEGS